MKKRMTLTFKSKKGNEYLYDDSTGLILPWSKEDEKILKQLLEGNKTEDILKDGDVHESKVHMMIVFFLLVHRFMIEKKKLNFHLKK